MAYSGTTQKTKINVAQFIEYAFRDAGKLAEDQTPEYINAAKQALFYIRQYVISQSFKFRCNSNKLW